MKERPILFSGAMVRAILAGRKTVTRRAIKPIMRSADTQFSLVQQQDGSWLPLHTFEESLIDDQGAEHPIACSYGQVGDRLWVRESFTDLEGTGIEHRPDPAGPLQRYAFAADSPPGSIGDYARKDYGINWKPSIHMPRAACRILLEITEVRIEQLQDGEGETAFESRYLAEGINRIHHGDGEYYYRAMNSDHEPGNWCDPFDAWRELWTSINGQESWDANPWVWVIEFQRVTA